MEQKEFDLLVDKIGKEATEKIKSELAAYKETISEMLKGTITQKELNDSREKLSASIEDVKLIVEKQGMTITDLMLHLNAATKNPSSLLGIKERIYADIDEIKSIYSNRTGRKTYMLVTGEKGKPYMIPFDDIVTKAPGPHATIPNIGGTFAASITQSIDAATLLRIGGASEVYSVYRNTPWLFDLINTYSVGFDNPFFLYYNEIAKDGTSATVAEGGTKPSVQYKYELKSATYKKEAVMCNFTEEFSIDLDRLYSDIMSKVQIDLINRINAQIQTNILAAATAYNDGTAYKAANGGVLTNVNDWDAIAAMAAQAESATFTNGSNVALVSTRKKYIMGTLKDANKNWVNAPMVLNPISVVSNPAMGSDDVLVGDLKQYNMALRGGVIVRIGYNGTDFADNRFSTVAEQYYFDYISSARTAALVKGATFAAVKTAITT